MRVSYTDRYYCDIGEGHRFPIRKYERVRDALMSEGTLAPENVVAPWEVDRADLALVHTEDYIARLFAGNLSTREIRRLGFPWSPALVVRSRASVQGTLLASLEALRVGYGANLAGGTHHAFPDHGEAFCTLNDMAVAIRVLRRQKLARRFVIVDCDVHQGNANAEIFSGDPEVFTFSMHGAGNYPLFKKTSSLDIELPKNAGDREYLDTLDSILPGLMDRFRPDLVLYQAGVDPHEDDRLGTLALTTAGLAARDRFVFEQCKDVGIPVVSTMGGGYGRDIDRMVDLHANTIRMLCTVFEPGSRRLA